MNKLITLSTLLFLFTFPLLIASKSKAKYCENDKQCHNSQQICINKKCVKGERFVALLTAAGSIGVINPENPVFEKRVSLPITNDVAVSPDNFVYAVATDTGLYKIDMKTQKITLVNHLHFPINLSAVTWGPRNLLYIHDILEDGTVIYVVNPKTACLIKTIPVPDFSRKYGDIAWVPEKNAFYADDGENGDLYAITLDGKAKFVSNIGANAFGMAYYVPTRTLYAYRNPDQQCVIDLDDGSIDCNKSVKGLDDGIYSAGSR